MGNYYVIKEIQFDAGHRVPQHESKCRNPHGHRYRVEVAVGARSLQSSGPGEGMVLDFGFIGDILREKVHDVLDHGFIVHEGDTVLLEGLGWQLCGRPEDGPDYMYWAPVPSIHTEDWKVIVFPYVPTAECIAQWVFEQVEEPIKQATANAYSHSVFVDAVVVYETPTCRAVYQNPYFEK